jgi:hypothetical protein
VQQDDAELALEAADVAAQRRLRHADALGGAPEVQLGRERLERAQVTELRHGAGNLHQCALRIEASRDPVLIAEGAAP